MNTCVEIHTLQNFAPSNLNRDDTGAPKDAIFGGTRRARVSSQCIKRAVRQRFAQGVQDGEFHPEDVAVRTKRLLDELIKALIARGRSEQDAGDKAREALGSIKLTIKDDAKSQYLLFLGRREIERIADAIHEHWDKIKAAEPEEGKKAKGKKKKKGAGADSELKKALARVLDGGKAVDVALFGRMLADLPEKNQDAACQVAHAISTHAVDREFDFYTAVDDLKPDDTAGADMMGTVEFNSACFYRYAMLDWDKLVTNLQQDQELASKGVRAFLEGFVLAEPTGKQNTFAAHNPPEFIAISVRRHGTPRNLANAFELAVRARRGESLTKVSAEALARKAAALQAAFGGDGQTFVLDLTEADTGDFGTRVSTLVEMIDKAVAELEV